MESTVVVCVNVAPSSLLASTTSRVVVASFTPYATYSFPLPS
jgi:hypothetical protein